MATPLHSMRIQDDIWAAAVAKAAKEGTSVTRLVEAFLATYVGLPDHRRPSQTQGPTRSG